METRVEKDADMIEDTTDMITELSQQITAESEHMDEDLLVQIKDLQEKVTVLRQNLMDKQRVISNLLKCDFFPEELYPRLTMIIKDINSLFDYTKFGFDRLDYLQDTFLSLAIRIRFCTRIDDPVGCRYSADFQNKKMVINKLLTCLGSTA